MTYFAVYVHNHNRPCKKLSYSVVSATTTPTYLQMTSWVCTEILTRDTPAARATVIEHFVQIALHCYKHNDMHCALNITVALASSSIKGLSKTWEEVDRKVSR